MFDKTQSTRTWEVPHQAFLDIVAPSFAGIDAAGDMAAILARTHIIVIADHGVCWRVASTGNENVRFTSGTRSFLMISLHLIKLYKKDPFNHSLPQHFHEDSV